MTGDVALERCVEEMGQLGNVFAILRQGGFLRMAHPGYEPQVFGARQGVIDLQGALKGQQRIIHSMYT
jgi:hypothetical protein